MLRLLRQDPFCRPSENSEISVLELFGFPEEMVAGSFALQSDQDLEEVTVSVTDVHNHSDSINVELWVIKVWLQAGLGLYQTAPVSVGELLLKDDRVALVDGYRSRCHHFRHFLRKSNNIYSPPEVRLDGPVKTSLTANISKQIFLSIKVPGKTQPGNYRGHIQLAVNGAATEHSLEIRLTVLPLRALEPKYDLCIWYKGTLDCAYPQHHVSRETLRHQLQDIFDHGFTSVSLGPAAPRYIKEALEIARGIGFKSKIFFEQPYPSPGHVRNAGLTPVFYLSDEIDWRGEPFIKFHKRNWSMAKNKGVETLCSLTKERFSEKFLNDGEIGCRPDVFSYYLPYNREFIRSYSYFKDVRAYPFYYYWPLHMEKPNLHRVLAGLYLWKSGASGIFPYCYQHLPQAPFSPFNDFDEWEPSFHIGDVLTPFKDHMATYPARNGSIPTVQWKGVSQGLWDLRYLATLDSLIHQTLARDSQESKRIAEDARACVNGFLSKIKLEEIAISSDSQPEPYPEIDPIEFVQFRSAMAEFIISLHSALWRT